jgi:hypothetical protein
MRIQAARRKIVRSRSRCDLWSERPRSVKGLLMIRDSRTHAGRTGDVGRIVPAMSSLPTIRDTKSRDQPGVTHRPGAANSYLDGLDNAGMRVAHRAVTGDRLRMLRAVRG